MKAHQDRFTVQFIELYWPTFSLWLDSVLIHHCCFHHRSLSKHTHTHAHTSTSETPVLSHFILSVYVSKHYYSSDMHHSVVITTLNSTELEKRRRVQSTARTPALGMQTHFWRTYGHYGRHRKRKLVSEYVVRLHSYHVHHHIKPTSIFY